MTDRIILELSPAWFVLADDQQWIVAKSEKTTDAARFKRRQARFKAVGYVGGRKATLERLTREKGVPITPESQAVMDTWPHDFLTWQRQSAEAVAA